MQDLIERRAALTALCEDCLRKYDGICPHPASRCVEFRTIKQLPAIDWIPCSERLPEVYEKVLTYNDKGIIHDNFRLNLKDGSVGWSQGWGITHWQPRPEPPEKEDADDT